MPSAEYMREYRKRKKAEKAVKDKKKAAKKQKKAEEKQRKAEAISEPKRKSATDKGGNAPKDAAITDNFNPDPAIKPTRKDIKQAIEETQQIMGDDDGDELELAYRMLEDMRHVYKEAGGRDKLAELALAGDKEFMVLVKDLMKIELAMLSAKIRKDGSTKEPGSAGGNQNFFVVLKGLESEQALVKDMDSGKDIDVKQIKDAINPDKKVIQTEENTVARDAPPEEITFKSREEVDPFEGELDTEPDITPDRNMGMEEWDA